ncbi:MAG: hypothetical protein ABIR79_22205 [Candidatus Binatia bacterium]
MVGVVDVRTVVFVADAVAVFLVAVADVADAVTVLVDLVGIERALAVVAGVADAVLVTVRLVGVVDATANVHFIAGAVGVFVLTTCVSRRDEGASQKLRQKEQEAENRRAREPAVGASGLTRQM